MSSQRTLRDRVAAGFVGLLRLCYRRLGTRRGLIRLCRIAARCAGRDYLFPVSLCDGRELRLDLREVMVSDLVLHGDWRQEGLERDLVRDCLQAGSVFYDIGANVGWYTTLALQHLNGRGLVCAFEPNPQAYRMLVASVANYSNVRTFPIAVSDQAGEAVLYVPPSGDMASLRCQDGTAQARRCPTDRLSRLVAAEALPSPDLIKLDVEGAELPALRGAEDLLIAHAPVLLFEYPALTSRMFGYRAPDLLSYLPSLPAADYVIFSFSKGPHRLVPMTEAPSGPMNLVAVPRRRLAWVMAWTGSLG